LGFLLISTNGGFNFWIGSNPLATGEDYAEDGEDRKSVV
jgi:hypothetical protein